MSFHMERMAFNFFFHLVLFNYISILIRLCGHVCCLYVKEFNANSLNFVLKGLGCCM